MKWLFAVPFHLLLFGLVQSWNSDSVLLRDVQVLTLYRGRYTNARRSSPIPQLQCVGGSAGCHAFVPEVVQCQNRGWDGMDVQWECKTDMDNAYRFGSLVVSCEGYNNPNDDYILKGSCGLEYSLELTVEGQRKTQGSWGSQGGLGGFASSFFKQQSQQNSHHSYQPSDSGDAGSLLVVVVLLLLAFAVYKLFLSGNTAQDGTQTGYSRGNHYGSSTGPPPPGFRPDFTDSASSSSCGANPGYGFRSDYTQFPGGRASTGTGPGFWSGMGAGGILGYLFGRQRNQPYHQPYHQPYYNNNSPYSNYNNSRPASAPSSSSSGTRTASGFGGTKRR